MWEVIKATGGYYFVQKNNSKGHLVKSFSFWGDNEGRYEAKELCEFLNKQDRTIERMKKQLNEQYGEVK